MNDQIKRDILSVITQARIKLKEYDFDAIKELSNHTIHNAGLFQDADSISLAVIMYALAKLADRSKDHTYIKNVQRALAKSQGLLEDDKHEKYRQSTKDIFKLISSYDAKFKMYIDEVVEKAEVKKGGKLHEHGISMAKAAEILGVGQWELMSYIGKTSVHDQFVGAADVKKRIEFARSLFE